MVFGWLEARGFVASAIHIDLVAAQPTHEMMVRFDVRVVTERAGHHVGTTDQACGGKSLERVVHGVERDSGKVAPEVFGHFFGRCMTPKGDQGVEHTESLLSYSQARSAQPVDEFVASEVWHCRVLQSSRCSLYGAPPRG